MEYRLGKTNDIQNICNLVKKAIDTMEKQGIKQWDEWYPTKDDLLNDIQKNTLYVAIEDEQIVAIYVISRECDEEYDKCKWENGDETSCIIHRLCVSPEYQNMGIGKQVLEHVEHQLLTLGYESVRLDVFTENLYAIKLYEKAGYVKRGYADWRKGRFWLMEKKL